MLVNMFAANFSQSRRSNMDSLVPAERSNEEASRVDEDFEIRTTVTKERYHYGNKHVEKTITVEKRIRAIRPQEDDHHRERSERRDPERSKRSERHDRPDRRESSGRRDDRRDRPEDRRDDRERSVITVDGHQPERKKG